MLKYSVFFFLLISLSAISQKEMDQQAIVATVDGEPICGGEFNLIAQKYKSIIIQEFRTKYGISYNHNFWQNKITGQTPTEALRKRTINALVTIKVQQILAKKNDLVDDISYEGFLKNLNSENRLRTDALKDNKVIFGPTQYSETVYYDYLLSNLGIRLKNVLAKRQFEISDDSLRLIYERQKEDKFRIADYLRIRVTKVKGKYKKGNVSALIASNVTGLQLSKNDTIFDNNCEVSTQEIIINPIVQSSEDNEINRSLQQVVEHLKEGEKTYIIESPNCYIQYLVLERKPLGYRSFESCRNSLKSAYTDSCYVREINKLHSKAIIVQY